MPKISWNHGLFWKIDFRQGFHLNTLTELVSLRERFFLRWKPCRKSIKFIKKIFLTKLVQNLSLILILKTTFQKRDYFPLYPALNGAARNSIRWNTSGVTWLLAGKMISHRWEFLIAAQKCGKKKLASVELFISKERAGNTRDYYRNSTKPFNVS